MQIISVIQVLCIIISLCHKNVKAITIQYPYNVIEGCLILDREVLNRSNTGYKYELTWPDICCSFQLYKNVFSPETDHTLAFIGFVQAASGGALMMSETQARWWAELCQDHIKLPTKVAMENNIDTETVSHRFIQTPSSEMFKSLNWMPLRDRVTYRKACDVQKSKLSSTCIYVRNV